MSKKIKTGIIGGAGYTGGELVRLLLHHPHAELQFVVSQSQAGRKLTDLHSDLLGDTDLTFAAEPAKGADVVFLCLPHAESKKYLEANPFLFDSKIVDLSRDFRIQNEELKRQNWVYGLPELHKSSIQKAAHIANPGCFATAIQLGLLPLANVGALKGNVYTSATTGSTGAGQSLTETGHFSWRSNNLSVYKALKHDHLPEMKQSLLQLQGDFAGELLFVPHRGAFTRGILASSTVHCELSHSEVESLFTSYYLEHPFVHLVGEADIKQVSNTNKCFIQLVKQNDQLVIITVIDNLLKGASGQAVQNMNLLFGLEEAAGLKLKANVF